MPEFIDLRELYTSIAGSMDDANRVMDKAAQDGGVSYAITDLEFVIPFTELRIENKAVNVLLAKAGDVMSEARNLRFKVRLIPRAAAPEVKNEEPDRPKAKVPHLLNKTLDDAQAEIKAWGFEVGNIRYDPSQKPAGHILSQTPTPLTSAEPGAKVDLVIAGEAPKPTLRKKAPSKESKKQP